MKALGMDGEGRAQPPRGKEDISPPVHSSSIPTAQAVRDLLELHLGTGGVALGQTHLVQFMLLLVSAPADVCARVRANAHQLERASS